MSTERKAFVEVRYTDSGPGLAGAYPGTMQCADVLEVTACSEKEAEKKAYDTAWAYRTAGGIQARFIRWAYGVD